jgi:S1-C subfamily serine protease
MVMKTASLVGVTLIVGILLGGIATYAILSSSNSSLQSATSEQSKLLQVINALQTENQNLRNLLSSSAKVNYTLLGIDPVAIYQKANRSVVTIQGIQQSPTGPAEIIGSGFVIEYQNKFYIVTNYHVVQNIINGSVTFSDGNSYQLNIVGTDPYSDLAIVNISAPINEFVPLTVVSSSDVKVGEPVVAIGNPFGLSGSITLGIVSQLGRTITESLAGNFPIADVIQFSAPVNPGNSGGPLINSNGSVIGITTAIVGGSQGVGFAIPSETLLRELPFLIKTGSYNMHPYMGIAGVDMNLQLSKLMKVNVTYGVLVQQVVPGGPADKAGIRGGNSQIILQGTSYTLGGDIIVSLNGTKIINTDALSTYLERYCLPAQKLIVGLIREGKLMYVDITLGTRPPPP